jgi:hypothetical protein
MRVDRAKTYNFHRGETALLISVPHAGELMRGFAQMMADLS